MESEALDAFFAHIAGFASVPVYWPNVADSGQPDGDHYRVSVLPVAPDTYETCGGSRYTWIVQVAIYIRDGLGAIRSGGYADLLRAGLPFNLKLTSDNYSFQTTEVCTVIPSLTVAGWFITPVQCRFITLD